MNSQGPRMKPYRTPIGDNREKLLLIKTPYLLLVKKSSNQCNKLSWIPYSSRAQHEGPHQWPCKNQIISHQWRTSDLQKKSIHLKCG